MSSFRVPFGVFVAALILALANLEHAHPVKSMGRLTIEQASFRPDVVARWTSHHIHLGPRRREKFIHFRRGQSA